MGCRSFLGYWENEEGVESYDGRNNIGVVSINLPMAAIGHYRDLEGFWKELDELIAVAKAGLDYRIERLSTVRAKSAPLLYCEGAFGLRLDPEEFIIEHLHKRGSSISLGYIGINEVVNALFGTDEKLKDSKQKQEFGLEIIKYLKSKVDSWKEADGWGWSLYATPAENLCDRFCKLIVKKHGEVDGVTDRGYLTNSFHVEVGDNATPFEKIDIESKYPEYSSGGFITFTEWASLIGNEDALESVWDYTYSRIPYYATNTPVDTCFLCSFSGDFSCSSRGFKCPSCGNSDPKTSQVIKRTCGYLGSPDRRGFNEGKQREVVRRVKHSSL